MLIRDGSGKSDGKISFKGALEYAKKILSH